MTTYTPEQLATMSDQEINLAVAKKLGVKNIEQVGSGDLIHYQEGCITVWEPCENWNDVMPIAYKYEIFPVKEQGGGVLHSHNQFISFNKNPKRAICEVFLQMEIE